MQSNFSVVGHKTEACSKNTNAKNAAETNHVRVKITSDFASVPDKVLRVDMREIQQENLAQQLCMKLGDDAAAISVIAQRVGQKAAFLTRAMAWIRLSDRLISESGTRGAIALENVDEADLVTQRDVARLIQFHRTQRIPRDFFLVSGSLQKPLSPELLAAAQNLHESRVA